MSRHGNATGIRIAPLGGRRHRIQLSPRTIEILESEAHKRDCSVDTLINELMDLADMEKRRAAR